VTRPSSRKLINPFRRYHACAVHAMPARVREYASSAYVAQTQDIAAYRYHAYKSNVFLRRAARADAATHAGNTPMCIVARPAATVFENAGRAAPQPAQASRSGGCSRRCQQRSDNTAPQRDVAATSSECSSRRRRSSKRCAVAAATGLPPASARFSAPAQARSERARRFHASRRGGASLLRNPMPVPLRNGDMLEEKRRQRKQRDRQGSEVPWSRQRGSYSRKEEEEEAAGSRGGGEKKCEQQRVCRQNGVCRQSCLPGRRRSGASSPLLLPLLLSSPPLLLSPFLSPPSLFLLPSSSSSSLRSRAKKEARRTAQSAELTRSHRNNRNFSVALL